VDYLLHLIARECASSAVRFSCLVGLNHDIMLLAESLYLNLGHSLIYLIVIFLEENLNECFYSIF